MKGAGELPVGSTYMSDFADLEDGPFDQLHPCCQKEIENKRQQAKVTKELRTIDRSFQREDMRKKTLANPWASLETMRCNCCVDTTDYPLLQQVRLELRGDSAVDNLNGGYLEEECVGEGRRTGILTDKDISGSGSDSDSDFGDIDFDDDGGLMDEIRKRMMDEVEKNRYQRQQAEAAGFSRLTEDSADHLVDLIVKYQQPLVVHMYDPLSRADAHIQLLLEQLAEKYIGDSNFKLNMSMLKKNLTVQFPLVTAEQQYN